MKELNELHVSWEQLPTDSPMSLLTRQRIIGQQMMISRVVLQKGCLVPSHAHANEQMAMIASGALRFVLGPAGETVEVIVRGGEVLHLPSNLPHSAEALEETVVYDVFSPPSQTTGIDVPSGR